MKPAILALALTLLFFSFFSVDPAAAAVAAPPARLDKLVAEYEAAKAAHRAAAAPPRRKERRQRDKLAPPPDLAPILQRIARLRSDASLRFLAAEYHEPDAVIPQSVTLPAIARALLSIDSDVATRIACEGYDGGTKKRRNKTWNLTARTLVLDLLARSTSPRALAFVLRRAASSHQETRLLALGSLALAPKNPQALAAVLTSLRHRSPEVRRAALRALHAFRHVSIVPALISRIAREKDRALRSDSHELLVRLTGLDMGLSSADWEKWWQEEGESYELDAENHGRTSVRTADLNYFGIEVSSSRIAFLVDASKSMQGPIRGRRKRAGKDKDSDKDKEEDQPAAPSKIDVLKKELTGILSQLPETTSVNIIYFHRGAFAWKNKLHPLRGKGRAAAIAFVEGLQLAGKTAIYDALELALEDQRVETIYFLSDGRPVGGKISDPQRILDEVRAKNRLRGAKIHCLSFGKETEFTRKLAAENNGTYRAIGGRTTQRKKSTPPGHRASAPGSP